MDNFMIVEAGSTKTDWYYIFNDQRVTFQTNGINPVSSDFFPELSEIPNYHEIKEKRIKSIFYFGAGVIGQKQQSFIVEKLSYYFDSPSINMEVYSDIYGAALSTAGKNDGLISILGTGSNSCSYINGKIKCNIPALGHIISNEGGGTAIGKKIIQTYFYKQMPNHVQNKFNSIYQLDKSIFLKNLNNTINQAAYLASFAGFLSEVEDQTWRSAILKPALEEFVDLHIKSYHDYSVLDLHFVGSIAYLCRDVLTEILESQNLRIKSILQRPIDGLVEYFKNE